MDAFLESLERGNTLDSLPESDPVATRVPPPKSQRTKRRRTPTSCNYCRRRKLKCDKNKPCGTCVKKNNSRCEYADPPNDDDSKRNSSASLHDVYEKIAKSSISRPAYSNRSKDRRIGLSAMIDADESGHGSETAQGKLKKRLDTMESLLMTIMSKKNDAESTTGIDTSITDNEPIDHLEESLGMLKLDERGKSVYHGDTHFVYLLQEMNNVHELFREVGKAMPGTFCNLVEGHTKSQSVLKTSGFTVSGRDVLRSIPSREMCELLVDRYFEVFNGVFDLVSRPWFTQFFHGFWMNPNSVDLIWLALLFCMILTAIQTYSIDDMPEEVLELYERHRNTWSQGIEMCFSIGRVSYKPSLANVRALVLWTFVQVDIASWQESAFFNLSMVVRVAQSMGLHRDPRYFVLSPAEAEERRRIWSLIVYLDTYFAISQGLPTSINPLEEDVRDPANIDLKDLDIGFGRPPIPKDLHGSRTSSSFLIFRHQIARLQLKAYSSHLGIKRSLASSKELWDLDAELRAFYKKLPRAFRLKTEDLSQERPETDDARLLMFERIWLRLEILRSLVILHRLCSRKALSNPNYNSSRKVTVECSLEVIDIFHWMMFSEYGKAIYAKYNWMLFALLNTYFMHATIVAGLKLSVKSEATDELKKYAKSAVPKAVEILKFLEDSGKVNGIVAQLLRIFLSFCQNADLKNAVDSEDSSQAPTTSSTKKYTLAGEDVTEDNEGSVFMLGLDGADAVYGLSYLHAHNESETKVEDEASPSSVMTENKSGDGASPISMLTGKSTAEEISPDSQGSVNLGPEMLGMYGDEMEREFGLLQSVASPSDMAAQLFDGIFGDDMNKKQDMMATDVWDSYMQGFDQENMPGLSRQR